MGLGADLDGNIVAAVKVVVRRLLDGVPLVIECCHMVVVVVETMSRCRLNHQRG